MIQAKIEALLKDKIGLEVGVIGSQKISLAIEKRRLACGLADLRSYLQRLQTSNQELEELIELVVVPETWFFRDHKPFTFLEHYVKSEWLPNQNDNILRVLSVPCSSGEEPYSISMVLLNAGITPEKFRIDAVDISKKALEKAQKAVYNKNSFRGQDLVERERYFQLTAESYQLSKLVRNTVNFIHGNILEPLFLANKKYDIIFCRNLLIYFDSSTASQVINILERLLTPKGVLFMGSAEASSIPNNRFVSVRYPFSFAYRKVADKVTTVTDKLPVAKAKEALQKPETTFPGKLDITVPATSVVTIPDLETVRNLADEGRLDEAATLCKSYLEHHTTDAQAYLLLGEVYQAKRDHKQAELYFQKAIYLEPNYYEALIHLSLLKEYNGDRAGAAALQRRIQRLNK
ncbi:chemotaxis protein CheR [Aetokthonos hydrillicola Thurmond2011]|jgi:chemotaxis protein methyltransferase WspC|uniref:Chemotaxis protein CheR n=1 Tax=Aetokthonos hydrillicola Thurmond2011 TaxID=2712845 RepID=A0AAP5M5M5_9CYAN|nr:protein-glutamate O-methyltransferase CheR [Aetokthonos hydrillicola]MBO3458706.1 chemotaxis protein CheR [Aetokthonos hydrillicola CCALA 1050]MBW4585456.1 chemotaxis protein CheR [Aetokthonos hydrillicola CCALA 1050]MDR9896076.1 chemotaxis protein CheR [Aetokthonos hydrillicola Thurmond2011]